MKIWRYTLSDEGCCQDPSRHVRRKTPPPDTIFEWTSKSWCHPKRGRQAEVSTEDRQEARAQQRHLVRVPPSLWPQLAQLFGIRIPVRWTGEEWFLEGIPTRTAEVSDVSSPNRRSGARGGHPRRDQHNLWRILKRRVHRLLTQEICQRSDGSRSPEVIPDTRARPHLHQGRLAGRDPTRQWPSGDLSGNGGKKGTPCSCQLGKLGRGNVLVDLQQTAAVSWPIETLRWLFVWFRGRPSRSAWIRSVEDNLH